MTAHRNGGRAQRVPDVEALPCPAATTTHTLTNDRRAVTTCEHCAQTWAALDAGIRAAIGWKAAVA